ncbi:MAG: TIM barrel protein [Desulfohalobiaceae bacterium]|nr:TIM barrel protein [Desulfohalobiaceae bacterium]
MLQLFSEPPSAMQFYSHRQPIWPKLQLAVSAVWRHGAERLDWIAANGLACAFTPNPDRLDLISRQLIPYIDRGMAVRHHGFFPGKEIGHALAGSAEDAMQLHFKAMEALQGVGEQLMTVHVGLDPNLPLDSQRVVKNLTRLVGYGKKKIGVTVSLENLRQGPTANPRTLREWAQRSGAGITLDIGHALSSGCVRRKAISVEKIIDLAADRLMEVHLYESETDRHWAPRTMEILGPIVDRLLTTACRWWTIELEDTRDICRPRQLLADHFETNRTCLWRETEAACVLPA